MNSEPIPIGTTIVVPVGDKHLMGEVHASAPDRIYCVMLDPPLSENWKPVGESWWIVKDIALRDGSWQMKSPRPTFEPESIRRFAGASDEARYLIAPDPRTLVFHGAPTRVTTYEEEREWERAPHLLPVSHRSFMIALARTVGLPAPVEPAESEHEEEESRTVIAMLRQRASNVALPLAFEHVLFFKRHRDGREALAHAQRDGLAATLETLMLKPAMLTVTMGSVPSYPLVRPAIQRLRALAAEHHGVYDGFGALAR